MRLPPSSRAQPEAVVSEVVVDEDRLSRAATLESSVLMAAAIAFTKVEYTPLS